MRGSRFSKAQRIKIVERLYMQGKGPREIHEFISLKWKVSYQRIRQDVVEIRKAWQDRFRDLEQFGDYAGEYLQRAMDLYQKAVEARDYRCAYKILQDIAMLRGVELKQPAPAMDPVALHDKQAAELDTIEAALQEAMDNAGIE